MAKRKANKWNSPKALMFLALCVVVSVAWRMQSAQAASAETVQTSGNVCESTATSRQPKTTKTDAKGKEAKRVTRAKGIEIPAYLTDRREEIVQHEGFTLSYNNQHLIPNWVAWVLTAERTRGTEKRADNFQPDASVKAGPVAEDSDYRRSGYDRGHMCPAADCKHSRQAQNDCFLLSNICPQLHAHNAGDWEVLERKCRQWAVAYDSIFIVCGPVLQKGETYPTIGKNKVTVPAQYYKVVLRLTVDGAEAIGFIMNNTDETHPLAYYATTVDEVELLTGINFFSKLDRRTERKAEATFDVTRWKGL